jgi:hypothetical protein
MINTQKKGKQKNINSVLILSPEPYDIHGFNKRGFNIFGIHIDGSYDPAEDHIRSERMKIIFGQGRVHRG